MDKLTSKETKERDIAQLLRDKTTKLYILSHLLRYNIIIDNNIFHPNIKTCVTFLGFVITVLTIFMFIFGTMRE